MQHSVAARHYPHAVWRDKQKMLWNPIQRRAFKNRPEERVRLRIIEYLLHGGWSKHRISTEEAIEAASSHGLRTDLICYSPQVEPRLLIECKAEAVAISGQTADQIARYNEQVGAPHLMMTNGVRDFWYAIAEGNVRQLTAIPDPFPSAMPPETRPFDYWSTRGFVGKKAAPAVRTWLVEALNRCFLQNGLHIRHIAFSASPSDLDLANYYVVVNLDTCRLALSFTSTPYGGNRLIAIINREKENVGMMEIDLDRLFDDRGPNTHLYDHRGVTAAEAQAYLRGETPSEGAEQIARALHRLYREQLS